MCRMLIAIGDVKLSPLLDSAIKMAKDENTVHELNEDLGQGSWTHSDGWGIAYISGKSWVIDKSTKSIFHDPKVDALRELKTNIAIIHVRKKMGSEVKFENTHPFHLKVKELGDFIFCHNGYIEEKINHCPSFSPKGETDSEKLFYAILSAMQDDQNPTKNIQETLSKYNKCTGTNVILSTKEKSFISTRKNKFPKYYQMKRTKVDGMAIVSSEILDTYKNAQWESVKEGEVISINHKTVEISIHPKELTV